MSKKRKEVYKESYRKGAVIIHPEDFAEQRKEWEIVQIDVIAAGKHDDDTEFQTVKLTLKKIEVSPKFVDK